MLAGLSAFLYGRGKTTKDRSHFLLIRGLWLILIEFTLIKFGWRFDFDLYHFTAGVIFVIGASMILLAALIWLPRWAIACVAFAIIGGHNLLDGVRAEDLGEASWVWHVLHQPGPVPLGDVPAKFHILYPLIPWIGVMAAGYLLGPLMQLGPGAQAALFVQARRCHHTCFYRSSRHQPLWRSSSLGASGNVTFNHPILLELRKISASLLYLMMTLGPALMLLASFESARGAFACLLATYGQVPFFFTSSTSI